MLIENIDLKVGVANGTIGIVTKLEFDLEDNVCSISVALNPLGYVEIVRKKSIQNKYDYQGHFYKTNVRLCNYRAQIPRCNDIIQNDDTYS
jgi:hypothetical protein